MTTSASHMQHGTDALEVQVSRVSLSAFSDEVLPGMMLRTTASPSDAVPGQANDREMPEAPRQANDGEMPEAPTQTGDRGMPEELRQIATGW
jgi:hypothetical protein